MKKEQAILKAKKTTFTNTAILKPASELLVKVAQAVYSLPEKPASVDSWIPLEGFDNIIDGTKESRAAIFAASDNSREYIIAFKGSESFKSWIADFSITPVAFTPHDDQHRTEGTADVHEGFNEVYDKKISTKSMADVLFQFIKTTAIDKLYITGHSLGGAVAKLFLYDLMKSLNSDAFLDIICVTFAAPKIGIENTKQDFESLYDILVGQGKQINYINMVIIHDIVPDLPPYPYVFSGEYLYIHSGNPIEHEIVYYIKWINTYFDLSESNFRVEKNHGIISLVEGKLAWTGKNIIDLVPGYTKLSDIFPRVDNINLICDPGKWYDYTVNLDGGSYSHTKTSHLTFHYEDGSSQSKSIFLYDKHLQTIWSNGGKIIRIDWVANYHPTVSEEDKEEKVSTK